MTQNQVNKLTVRWQRRLRLQDWNILVEFVEQDYFKNPTQTGETTIKQSFKDADVKVLQGLDSEETELILVHELLHILFGGMCPPEGVLELLFETGIEGAARALLEAYKL